MLGKLLIHFLAIYFLFGGVCARGDIYTNSVSLSFANGQGIIWAWTLPNFMGDGAGLTLSLDNNLLLRPTNYTVGIGHVWYSVTQGTVIDPAFALAAPQFANAFTGYLGGMIQVVPDQPFLLEFWLEANGNQTPGAGDRLGRARLVYSASTLTLVDNAIESTGAGIIAGTTIPVPEPSPLSLVLKVVAAAPILPGLRTFRQRT